MPQSFARQLVAYIAAVMLPFAIFLMLATLAAPAHAQQATSNLVSGSGSGLAPARRRSSPRRRLRAGFM
jgi:hypothetical protein